MKAINRIDKAVEIINRSIKFYQRKLSYQAELRVEYFCRNANLDDVESNLNVIDENIHEYLRLLGNLATIKRAIKEERCMVVILEMDGCETCISDTDFPKKLRKIGIEIRIHNDGIVSIFPIETPREKRLSMLKAEIEERRAR